MKAKEMIGVARWLLEDEDVSWLDGAAGQAARILRWALEVDPENRDARWLLGNALIKAGRPDEARPILEALDLAEEPDALAAIALARAACFDFGGAARAAGRALEIDPADWRHYANRGLFRFHMAEYAEAAADLARAAVVADPSYLSGVALAQAQGAGDFSPLLGGFAKIREEVGPCRAFRLIDAWADLATHGKGGPAALARLRKLPAGERRSWEAIALRAACARAARFTAPKAREDEATLLREAIAARPDETALIVRGLESGAFEDDAGKLDAYERVFRGAPDWVEGLERAASLALGQRQAARALPWIERACRLFETVDAVEERAKVYVALGRYEEALEQLLRLEVDYGLASPRADDEPDDGDDAIAPGWDEGSDDAEDDDAESEEGDDEDGGDEDEEEEEERDEFGEATSLAHYLGQRAQVRLRLRDLALARADLDLACERAPKGYVWLHAERAWFRAVTGDRRGAVADLDHAIAAGTAKKDLWTKRRDRLLAKLGDPPREGAEAARKKAPRAKRPRRRPGA